MSHIPHRLRGYIHQTPPPTWTVANGVGIALTGMTLVSYIPQYRRLLALRSSAGLSVTSILFNTLMAQDQVANMYYLFKLRPQMEHGIPIANPPAARDWINLAQIMIQWACSLPLLALVITMPTRGTSPTSSPLHINELVSRKSAAILCAANALFYYLCTIIPGPEIDMVFAIVHNIHSTVFNPIATLLAAASFFYQARLTKVSGSIGALSSMSLMLGAGTSLVSALSWPLRLRVSENVYLRGARPLWLTRWYPLVGWACVNAVVGAVGQGVVFYFAGKAGSRTMRLRD